MPDIEQLISDREAFNAFVYTPLEEALRLLKERGEDPDVYDIGPVPEKFANKPKVVLHRQVITPNYEVSRFLSIAEVLGFEPLFFEFHDDKYVTENDWKYLLGKMHFYKGKGKKGGSKVDRMNIINFNTANGKKMSAVETIWGQRLIDFHHELFLMKYPSLHQSMYDGSEWYMSKGGNAKEYYTPFLGLFIKHGILFENFMLDERELDFTRDIFLPAFIEIYRTTGLKPLIVALEPTDIEGDNFWMFHPPETINVVKDKLK